MYVCPFGHAHAKPVAKRLVAGGGQPSSVDAATSQTRVMCLLLCRRLGAKDYSLQVSKS